MDGTSVKLCWVVSQDLRLAQWLRAADGSPIVQIAV